ncbi:MAG: MarR family transcriptional regulator [Kiritimatiellaeota bacterium]|nr:MarR family transcriptional regulator [Kiritimatiellota bacterium]
MRPLDKQDANHGREAARLAWDIRLRLVEVGGRTSQDLGLGRMVGQLLVYLYLWDGDCSLDQICAELRLSKASVSIAARQLERLGLLRRVWKPGDRKSYYRTADDIATALHQGLLILVRNKMGLLATELKQAETELRDHKPSPDTEFVLGRVKRAKRLRDTAMSILENPVVKLLTRVK